jgi:NAD kinase
MTMTGAIEKIVVVTRQTALDELAHKMGTRAQAKFVLRQEKARASSAVEGPDYDAYERADTTYVGAMEKLRAALPQSVRAQFVERAYLPTFTFGERDLVVVLGPDGLVVNTAKYLNGQPLLAFNPDPVNIEGVLLPFNAYQMKDAVAKAVRGALPARKICMARAELADGQSIEAVNDLFIGQKTHVSARYQLACQGVTEDQVSSGIIVSTGAGSTGWLRSVVAGAAGVVTALGGDPGPTVQADASRFDWEQQRLVYHVREPWVSRTTGATLVHGSIGPREGLHIVSQMPQNGVIFSDGIEADYLPFDSGAVVRIGLSDRTVRLLIPG